MKNWHLWVLAGHKQAAQTAADRINVPVPSFRCTIDSSLVLTLAYPTIKYYCLGQRRLMNASLLLHHDQ